MLIILDRETNIRVEIFCLKSLENWFNVEIMFSHHSQYSGERIYLDKFDFFITGKNCSSMRPKYSESVYEQLAEITNWWSKKEKWT